MPEAVEDLLAIKRLWVHEVLRVYCDRLVDDEDRNWIYTVLHQICLSNLDESMDKMFAHLAENKNGVVSYLLSTNGNIFIPGTSFLVLFILIFYVFFFSFAFFLFRLENKN